jgi:hypothetical protein
VGDYYLSHYHLVKQGISALIADHQGRSSGIVVNLDKIPITNNKGVIPMYFPLVLGTVWKFGLSNFTPYFADTIYLILILGVMVLNRR